jgi:hypothetical protein
LPAARAWQDQKPGQDAMAAIAGEVLTQADMADPRSGSRRQLRG